MNAYVTRLRSLLERISQDVVPSTPVVQQKPRVPTQAFSEFLINRELGDWAEEVVRRGVNDSGLPVVALPYGRTGNLVAGEPGFADFFLDYHEELRTLDKRPDLLIFPAGKAPAADWMGKPAAELVSVASQAVAGFEVRCSQQSLTGTRTPADLSFTPKIEDIRNVMRWIERHGVPHFYVQVIFGAAYALSFERILELLGVGPKAGGYTIAREPRNQFKATVYVPLDKGVCLSTRFQDPDLAAFRKQLSSGRMLFGVKFSGGLLEFDKQKLSSLLKI
ncbi:MAG TPA: AccI family restriction endonuclease [Candidatus Paceibacterota bacterium]|nr:AccI family restriction endonuclease [Candidatus Paceibacterota bacterium]